MLATEMPADFDHRLGTIEITIDEDDFEELLTEPLEHGSETEKACKAVLMFGSDTITLPSALRIHGAVSRYYPKKSFRLYFSDIRLSSDQIFGAFPAYEGATNSFSEIVLNANAIDFSNIRNYLSMLSMARLGGIVPRISFARLRINGGPYGLYTVIEAVNREMAGAIVGHANFDLLKSQGLNGNLTTQDFWTGDSGQAPARDFTVETGDTVSLCNFVRWVESDSFSYASAKTRCHIPSLFALFMGCMYTADSDALVKNFFFLYDKLSNLVYFIPWDADATFGRNWCGTEQDPLWCLCPFLRNGLYERLMKDVQWRTDVMRRFDEALGGGLSTESMYDEIDNLETLLRSAVQEDNVIWKDTLLEMFGWFLEPKSVCDMTTWDDREGDPLRIWRSDLDLIRGFIVTRQDALYGWLR